MLADATELPGWLAALPAVNASLNGLSTLLLICWPVAGEKRSKGRSPQRHAGSFRGLSHLSGVT